MICKNCGNELQANDKFCRKCGSEVGIEYGSSKKEKMEIVKIIYRQNTNELNVLHNDNVLDTSRIKDMSIDKWLYPFYYNGLKWAGLYEELKLFVGCEKFILQFDSDENTFKLVQDALSNKPIKLVGTNNNVVIIYSENPFTTKITINGKIYDTQIIQNRCLEEWIHPFKIRDIKWNGIFKELEEFIGIDTYTIYFIGEENFLNTLINECPPNVSIFKRTLGTRKNVDNSHNSMINTSKLNVDNVSETAKKTMNSIKRTISESGKTGKNHTENVNLRETQDLSLKWYRFFSKYGMMYMVILGAISSITYIWFSIKDKLIQFIPFAIFMIGISIATFYIRKKMLEFRKNVPVILTALLTTYTVGMFIGEMFLFRQPGEAFISILIPTILELILVFLNYIYFKKRDALFCN